MLFAAPLALRTGVTILGRVGLGLGFAAFGCVVWQMTRCRRSMANYARLISDRPSS